MERRKSAKARIADATERLSAPVERRRNSISHLPNQNITKEGNRLCGQILPSKCKAKLPTSMIVAPLGQRFNPVSPEVGTKSFSSTKEFANQERELLMRLNWVGEGGGSFQIMDLTNVVANLMSHFSQKKIGQVVLLTTFYEMFLSIQDEVVYQLRRN